MKRSIYIIMLLLAICSTALGQKTTAKRKVADKVTNGHEYVDLGLSVMWATRNIGATSPTDNGKFYAWGEIKSKSDFSISNYKFFLQTENEKIAGTYIDGKFKRGYTKYVSDIQAKKNGYDEFYDNKRLLDYEDDAARVLWGGKWRIPTMAEVNELCTKCTWEWTKVNGKAVYKVTGPNGKYIYMPAAGARFRMKICYAGEVGFYWTATVYSGPKANGAYILRFTKNTHGITDNETRYDGRTIRPVIKRDFVKPKKTVTKVAAKTKK